MIATELGRFTLLYTGSLSGKACSSQVHLISPWLPWDHVDIKEAEVHLSSPPLLWDYVDIKEAEVHLSSPWLL